MAYRGARGGPKSCRLGRVTQVDQARAQVGVHRYLPEVSGVRIKWVLAYLKEDGSMTSSEGSRPAIETVSVKEVITKVDLNRDGVLAASSARKLDKAGYLLQERTALVAPRESACGGLDLAAALSHVLVSEEGPSSPSSVELLSVKKWVETHLPKECLDILEVSWGEPVLSKAARLKGYSVGPAIVHGGNAYAVQWDLLKTTHVAAVVGALDLLKPRLLVVTLLGKGVPHGLYQLVVDRAVQRREYLAVCFTSEDGEWKPWAFEGWRRCFGTLSEPTFPWGFVIGQTTANSLGQLARVVLWPRSPASGCRTLASPRPVSGAGSQMPWGTFPTTTGRARLLAITFRVRLSVRPSRTLV